MGAYKIILSSEIYVDYSPYQSKGQNLSLLLIIFAGKIPIFAEQ